MEKRNKIKLTERFRQTDATIEIVAKFFSDKDSCLIVHNQMMKEAIITNHLDNIFNNDMKKDLIDRILVFDRNDFTDTLNKFETWYLDVCTFEVTKIMIAHALDLNKTLIGHYGDKEEWCR